MENTFKITYRDTATEITQLEKKHGKNTLFTAHLTGGDLLLECQEDDEGANHWLDAYVHHETPQSTEIGSLINVYMAENKKTI